MESLVTEMVGGEPYRYYPMEKYVVRAPGICGGRPTFKYTRIDIGWVLGFISAGESIDEIVEGYEGRVPREAIEEALAIANRHFHGTLPELAAAH
jgi:uncharacterized protein (DUF433 family)